MRNSQPAPGPSVLADLDPGRGLEQDNREDTMEQSNPKGFDFGAFDLTTPAEEGFELDVVDPASGKPFGASITIVGEHSDRAEQWKRRFFDRVQAKKRQAEKAGRAYEPTYDELQEQLVQQAVALTIGWKGFLDGGQPVPFSEDAVTKVYRKHDWLRDLVIAESRTLGNFKRR